VRFTKLTTCVVAADGLFVTWRRLSFPELGPMSPSIRDPKMREIQNCIDGENGEETDLGLGMLGVSVSYPVALV